MNQAIRPFVLALCAIVFVPLLHAATYIVPSDAEMIQQSDDIVVATAMASTVELHERGGIVTRFTFRVDDVLKGPRAKGSTLQLTEAGGVLNGHAKLIFGSPRYEVGTRYLIFVSMNEDFEPVTLHMGLGQFWLIDGFAMRGEICGFDLQSMDPHVEPLRLTSPFVEYIRDTARGVASAPTYFAAENAETVRPRIGANAGFTRGSYLMDGNFRWLTPSATFVKARMQPGANRDAAISTAFGQWNGAGVGISYVDGGPDEQATAGISNTAQTADGKNAILFDEQNGQTGGAAGIGGINDVTCASPSKCQYTLDGEEFLATKEVDVVIQPGSLSQGCLNAVLTHELGHTLGFRHADQSPTGATCAGNPNLDCTSDAVMNSSVGCGPTGANLRAYDLRAAQTVYGSGPVCTPATITANPQSVSINTGSSTTLSVVANGSTPITYAWFVGPTGTTTQPIGTNSPTLTVSPTSTTSYWVRVSNACTTGPVPSTTATVTVICGAPAITANPVGGAITEGQSVTLQVGATGGGLSFQWFQGPAGNTTTPIGSNSPSLNVAPTTTTSYWVRVSGTCGPPVDSAAATITVTPCADVEVDTPTATPNPGAGNFRLNVNAFSSSTPLSFAWFRGTTPGVGGSFVASTQAVNVTGITAATSFWARVTNACGKSTVSSLLTVAPCALPSITSQPGDVTIAAGTTTTLTVGFTAGATVKWYRGAVGDRSVEVGNTASVVVGPTVTTSYWAEVSTSCGPVASRQVTVTVTCALATITTQQPDVSIPQGTTTTLTIGFTGAGATVKWYRGAIGDRSAEVGNTASVFVGPNTTSTYWAEVTNACGAIASRLVTVTVLQTSQKLFLLNNRFQIEVRYHNQLVNPPEDGKLTGRTLSKSATSESAIFWFEGNGPNVVELMVRVSDARPFDNHIHLFYGGLTDVELFIDVVDTQNPGGGIKIKNYHKLPNQIVGEVDRTTFVASSSGLQSGIEALQAQAASAMIPAPNADSSTLRMLNNRYEVRVHYRNQFANPAQEGYLLGRSIASTPLTETCVFFFDNAESVEWMVRFSDARPFAQRIDFFHGGLSDVEYRIEVTDTVTGKHVDYQKAPFSLTGFVDRTNWKP